MHKLIQRIKQEDITREKLAKILFYIGLVAYLVWKIQSTSMFAFWEDSPLSTLIHWCVFLIFVASCVCSLRFDTTFVMAAALFVLGCIVKLTSGSILYVDFSVIFYASRCTDFKKIAKVSLIVIAVCTVFVILCSQIGIVEDYLWYRADGQVRHGLGFLYCTTPIQLLLNVFLLYVFVRKDKITVSELVGFFIINYLIYKWTDSRTSFYVITALVVGVLILLCLKSSSIIKYISFASAQIAQWSFIALTALALIAVYAYDPASPLWDKIDDSLSGRLIFTSTSLENYGVSIFGQDVELYGNGVSFDEDGNLILKKYEVEDADIHYIDCSYIYILFHHGVVSLIVFLAILWLGLRNNHDVWVSLIAVGIAIAELIEPHLPNLLFTTFLLWFWNSACVQVSLTRFGSLLERAFSKLPESLLRLQITTEIIQDHMAYYLSGTREVSVLSDESPTQISS